MQGVDRPRGEISWTTAEFATDGSVLTAPESIICYSQARIGTLHGVGIERIAFQQTEFGSGFSSNVNYF